MGQIKSFLKETLAHLVGDTDKVVAEKNYRKAMAAVNGQIAALKAQLVDDEQQVEDAKEALNAAKYPNTIIKNGEEYLSEIHEASGDLEVAERNLASTQNSIRFNEALLAEFDTQVDE